MPITILLTPKTHDLQQNHFQMHVNGHKTITEMMGYNQDEGVGTVEGGTHSSLLTFPVLSFEVQQQVLGPLHMLRPEIGNKKTK